MVQAVNEFGGLSAKGEAKDGTTGIEEIAGDASDVVATEIYDIRGMRLTSLTQGVNIVRSIHADGNVTVKKVVVK